jgi:hypothetical protein
MTHGVRDLTPWPIAVRLRAHYWRFLPPWAARYVPDAVGHDGRCIVLQNFWRTIYFCKIVIENIYKKSIYDVGRGPTCLRQQRHGPWASSCKKAGSKANKRPLGISSPSSGSSFSLEGKEKQNHLPLTSPKAAARTLRPPAIAAGTAASMTGSVSAASLPISPPLIVLSRAGATGSVWWGWVSDGSVGRGDSCEDEGGCDRTSLLLYCFYLGFLDLRRGIVVDGWDGLISLAPIVLGCGENRCLERINSRFCFPVVTRQEVTISCSIYKFNYVAIELDIPGCYPGFGWRFGVKVVLWWDCNLLLHPWKTWVIGLLLPWYIVANVIRHNHIAFHFTFSWAICVC